MVCLLSLRADSHTIILSWISTVVLLFDVLSEPAPGPTLVAKGNVSPNLLPRLWSGTLISPVRLTREREGPFVVIRTTLQRGKFLPSPFH